MLQTLPYFLQAPDEKSDAYKIIVAMANLLFPLSGISVMDF